MTRWRIGLGPVFAYERIASSRRWQGYALRALFLLTLLVALVVVWEKSGGRAGMSPIRYYRQIARDVFVAVIGTQLALVLLAAPAATAGAICLDRARGTLSHMLLTDLSDAEIVLGKLAGRLLPVLGLLACTLPLLEFLTLLGGVDPVALVGAFVITASLAALGCSLAMFLSLWMRKTHEALLATYAILGLWLVTFPILEAISLVTGWFWLVPTQKFNPFYMAVAPYWQPGDLAVNDYLLFTAAASAITLLLIACTTLKLRSVCTSERAKKTRPAPAIVDRGNIWRQLLQNVPWLTPSLDGNPVVWREWHRGGASRSKRLLIACFAVCSVTFSVAAILWQAGEFPAMVNAVQVAIGLLLVGVWSATSLAEERARGSLDLLMCAPLSTREIVTGKWLGAFRAAPVLAILPSTVAGFIAYTADQSVIRAATVMCIYMICAGAAVTSLGVLLATWFSRPGRAVTVTVVAYAMIAVGWLFVVATVLSGPEQDIMSMASPFFCAGRLTFDLGRRVASSSIDWAVFWTGASVVAGAAMLDQACRDFDRRLGRSEDVLARLGRPSLPARLAGLGCIALAALLTLLASGWDWVTVVAIELTLGSVVIAGIAASSPVGSLAKYVVNDSSEWRVSPARIVFAKWKGGFRYALALITIPALCILARSGHDFRQWGEFLMVVGYMLAVCAAAASLGVAMSMWFQRGREASSIAMLICLLPIVPWLGVATQSAGLDLPTNPSVTMATGPIEALDRAFISPGRGPSWMGFWIAVYLGAAGLLLHAARAKLAGMAGRPNDVALLGRRRRSRLTIHH